MAVYNGEKFLSCQVQSILQQLGDGDELIVVDDASVDRSREIIGGIADKRIKHLFNSVNRGHVFSFGLALEASCGEVVMLADQDDIWLPGRLKNMVRALESSDCEVVATGFIERDETGLVPVERLVDVDGSQSRLTIRNLMGIMMGRRVYYGCCMAFKANFKQIILPIPKSTESHDIWIAIVANLRGSMVHLSGPSIVRRVHGANVTPRGGGRSISMIFRSRCIFLKAIFIAIGRLLKR